MRVSMYVRAHRHRSVRRSSDELNLCGIPHSARLLEMSDLVSVLGVSDTIMRGVALGDLTRTQNIFFSLLTCFPRHELRFSEEVMPSTSVT